MKGKSNLLKEMMAMFLTTVLIIGMVVGAVPEEVHAKTTTDRYEYTDNEDGTVTITGYKGTETKLVIPATIDGKTVTAIESPGNDKSGFPIATVEVTIPGSVTSIGDYAFFNCSGLTRVTISEGVESIGDSAFAYCSGLTRVTIPEGVTSIGDYAFYDCEGLSTITIPGSVTSIGDDAFAECSKLTTVTIPGSVTSIGEEAFFACSGLTTVTISEGVESIGVGAFTSCSGLTRVTIPEGVTSMGMSAFAYCSKLTTVTIPGSVTSIGEEAFFACSGLTTVTISEGVESIGVGAFVDCEKLTTITIPGSVTKIGMNAFQGCSSLESVKYGCCKTKWGDISMSDSHFDADQTTVEYNVTAQEAKAATCTEEGYKEEYYECLGCHGAYSDPDGENSIAKPIIPATGHTPIDAVEENRVDATCAKEGSYDMVVRCSVCKAILSSETKQIPAKGHDWLSTSWKTDPKNHWHGCSRCDEKVDEAAHSYGGWTVTKQPTESEEGLQERSCSVCGYKQTEVIPKTGNTGGGDSTSGGGNTGSGNNTGKIETEEEQGENTPVADFQMSNDDLISAVLTPEEKSLVEAGADVRIILEIDNIDASVDEADKQAVTDKADGYNVGQYLDINLYKIIGEDRTKVSQTNGKIKIAIAVPDNLKNTDSAKTRSFAVVRVHDGVAELLTDLDNDDATITIETDMFSTYAIVYKDTVNTDKKDDEPKTGDTTPMELYATLAMIAGLTYLLLFLRNRKRGMKEQ